MNHTPQAFLSYTRLDDQGHHGGITALRAALELQVRVVTGDDSFDIFQDVDGIAFGEHWPDRLDHALAASRFLIPVLSPRFFRSEPCRDELRKFLAHERDAGRNDLILPIYWVQAPVLEFPHLTAADDLAAAISERQRWDWRSHAQASLTNQTVRKAIRKLAEAIAGRLRLEPPPAVVNVASFRNDHMPVREDRVVRRDFASLPAVPVADQYSESNRARDVESDNGALDSRAPAKVEPASGGASLDEGEAALAPASEVVFADIAADASAPGIPPPGKAMSSALAAEPARSTETSDLAEAVPASAPPAGEAARHGPRVLRRRASPLRRPYAAGDVFRDVEEPWCPEMVVIPAGSFTMGSPDTEEGRWSTEGPQRLVTFAQPFAIGRYTITFEQWDACVAAGGCDGYKPDDRGWGRGSRPVINVSWYDARAFVSWLSAGTGQRYRLPTEAEWEYAARAGTTTPFWTGATISTEQANYRGNSAYGAGKQGVYRRQTVAVDDPAFPANPFGLHHVHGNVCEWAQDCYRSSYGEAHRDGALAVEVQPKPRLWGLMADSTPGRVLRGGSWFDVPINLRSAYRGRFAPVDRNFSVGFRVARTLTP